MLCGIGLICLIGWSPAYAVDCSTTFDQSCLSGEYDTKQVEASHKRSIEQIERGIQKREEYKKSEEYIFNRAIEIINNTHAPIRIGPGGTVFSNADTLMLEAARQEGPEVYKIVYEHVMRQRAIRAEHEHERELKELQSQVEQQETHIQRLQSQIGY
jgi:hypothetical protein